MPLSSSPCLNVLLDKLIKEWKDQVLRNRMSLCIIGRFERTRLSCLNTSLFLYNVTHLLNVRRLYEQAAHEFGHVYDCCCCCCYCCFCSYSLDLWGIVLILRSFLLYFPLLSIFLSFSSRTNNAFLLGNYFIRAIVASQLFWPRCHGDEGRYLAWTHTHRRYKDVGK